ncbi:MAG: hypothetical protein MJ113_00915 [Lachnospiraceae bacterium]|nr:hypothetical protein [Lachnospiraceae bacterium]
MGLFEGRKRRWGDRKDGFLVRNLDPMTRLEPYLMPQKVDSWVLFEDVIDITKAQEFVRNLAKDQYPKMSLYHVMFAAMVRAISQVPQLNRFVVNSKIFARNEIKFAMVVKKGVTFDGERSVILPKFQPEDTLIDVYNKIQAEIGEIDTTVHSVEEDENKTAFDGLQYFLSMIPHWFLKFVCGMLRWLDKHGMLPAALTNLSPFHTSCFITNMGSFGMEAVHHHVYEFGTLSIFGALGKKKLEYYVDEEGNRKQKATINAKFVVDERVTGGFEYGMGFKVLRDALRNPESLMTVPEKVVEDVIDRPKRKKKK